MTQPSVAALHAENFRGIRRAELPLNGMNLILVGENGSGKSCFVDLLEYLFTGKLARLNRQDVKEKESISFVPSSRIPSAQSITFFSTPISLTF